MDPSGSSAERYIGELLKRTGGDAAKQVSMFEIGAAVGLEKEEARVLAEDLIAEGLVEIKTLSGGIGITEKGIDLAGSSSDGASGTRLELGKGPVLEESGRQALKAILDQVKSRLATGGGAYACLEEMIIDIKTIEVQLLSPRPKVEVIMSVLNSLSEGLHACGAAELADRVGKMATGR